MTVLVIRSANYALDWLRNWYWFFPLLCSAFFLYKPCTAFLPVKPRRRYRAALFIVLGGAMGMVIWVGDNNILFTMPVFFATFLACFRGNRTGRLAVGIIFFCLIMPVSATLDTYLGELLRFQDLYEIFTRVLRPVVWGLLYLAMRKYLPERPPQLSPKLWKLVLALSVLPLCSMLAVMLLTSQIRYESEELHILMLTLGLAVLPFVFLTSLALLAAIVVLEDHERLEEAQKLSELRVAYYQGLQREETRLRTLRHDLRNHLTAIRGLLAEGEQKRALDYIDQLSGSAAVQGGQRVCGNDTANAVLSAKVEAMRRAGIRADIAVSLPGALPVDDTDLCALLGNALDNAMEAALQAPEKWIIIRCRAEKGLLMLRVENTAAAAPPPDLSTSKEDKAAHGFGLPGMREIAERYGGSLETRALPGKFELVACLPLDGRGA